MVYLSNKSMLKHNYKPTFEIFKFHFFFAFTEKAQTVRWESPKQVISTRDFDAGRKKEKKKEMRLDLSRYREDY